MDNRDNKLDRLLRSAAQLSDEPETPPFGFETRVVALWRATANKPNGVARLVRRVALLSGAVLVASTAAAFWELKQSSEIGDSTTNEFAIADSTIENEFLR
jgi:hypothetical protein